MKLSDIGRARPSVDPSLEDDNRKLAERLAPRRLTKEQQTRVARTLGSFAGQKYTFVVGTGTEPVLLLEDIGSALSLAGWQAHNN